MLAHLFDLSRGNRRVAACSGHTAANLMLPEEFGALEINQCQQCVPHLKEYRRWITHCAICGEHIADGRTLADHQQGHALSRTSYRLQPLAFTVNVQSHYDTPTACSRTLAAALGELREHFPKHRFTDPIPARIEIQKDKVGAVMLGEGYVAEYLIVEK